MANRVARKHHFSGVMLINLNFSAERLLAKQLSDELVKQLPPRHFSVEKRGVLSVNKVSKSLERIYAIAREENQIRKMGLIRRSVFANGFKWRMREALYPDDFIDMATEGLLVELAKKN